MQDILEINDIITSTNSNLTNRPCKNTIKENMEYKTKCGKIYNNRFSANGHVAHCSKCKELTPKIEYHPCIICGKLTKNKKCCSGKCNGKYANHFGEPYKDWSEDRKLKWNETQKKNALNRRGKTIDEIYKYPSLTRQRLSKSLLGRKLTDNHKNKISRSMRGRKITWGNKISNALMGKHLSDEHKQHLKENHVGMLGKKHNENTIAKMKECKIGKNNPMYGVKMPDEVKSKKRISVIKHLNEYLKLHGKRGMEPNYNKFACQIFDTISKENNIHIQHALNDKEFFISELGYFLDGYDKENNVVYEYDEKHHYKSNGELREKDIIRQNEIINHLKCRFIRIQQDNNKNIIINEIIKNNIS